MSSTVEQQQDPPSNRGPSSEHTSSDMDDTTQRDVQKPSDEIDLASQTANLRLDDENANSAAASKTTITTTHDDVSASKTVDESPVTELEVRAAESVEQNQDMAIGNIGADRLAVGEKSLDIGVQNDTPRLSTYINLHNDMIRSKSALTSHTTEQLELYNKASHIARTLLESNEKYGDLPRVMHAHACLVLGCSDEDDCYERMEEAVALIKLAMAEDDLGRPEGEAMLKTCDLIMGMRGQASPARDDEESGGQEEAGDRDDGESDPESEGEDESINDEHATNDALP